MIRDRGVGWLTAATALVCAAVPLGVYLWAVAHRLNYPYELDGLEGGTVELVNRVIHGQSLYSAPTLGFAGFTYTPLYSYVAAGVAEVTGIGFLPLRIVSFGSSLVSIVALFMYVRAVTADWVAGAGAAGLFAATYGLTGWFFDVGRLDSMFLALALLALWFGRDAESTRAGIALGVLAFLAFFTKQVGLIALGPALVCAALARPRAGISALVTLIVLAGASTLLLDALTHGWYRFYIVSELAGQPPLPKLYVGFWTGDLIAHLHDLTLLVVLGGLAVLLRARRPARAEGTTRAASLLSVLRQPVVYDLAAAVGLLGAAWVSRVHSGSYLNVLIPAYAACAGLAGCALGVLRRRGLICALAATALVALQTVSLVEHDHTHLVIPTHADRAKGAALIAALRRLPGPVLVLRHPWYGTLAGQGAFAQSDGLTEILRSDDRHGKAVLDHALDGSLNRYHIRAILLDSPTAPAWLAPQLQRSFRLASSSFSSLVPIRDFRTAPTYLYLRRAG